MKKIFSYAVVLIWFFSASQVLATEEKVSTSSDYLTLEEVVKSAVKNYPKILSHYDKIRAAESNLLAAKGFFDIKLKQNYSDRTRGYYDGKSYDTEIEKHLGVLGSRVYGGYRKSYGKFPDYEGGSVTNGRGEFRAGAKFSLLKDRDIDQSRLSLILGNLSVEEAKIELENIKMEIARDATKAYWTWVAAGKILHIYEDLYQLSVNRQKQLEVRSQKGDVAQIIAVENRKNLLKRKASLVKVRQEFEASSIYLSLFWRDDNGNPIKPEVKRLPEVEAKLPQAPSEKEFRNAQEEALKRRPEIKVMMVRSDEQSSQKKYAENLLKPQLDVEVSASQDEGAGPISKAQSENYTGVNFSFPLQQREGRGKLAAAESKLSALRYERSLLEDQIRVEIDQIMIKLLTVSETHSLLTEEAKLAEVLQNAEVEKFKHGASNFFLVNLREQDLAASKAAVIEVFKEFQNSIADYRLAIFDVSN
jgi:outer membrane protein TolC